MNDKLFIYVNSANAEKGASSDFEMSFETLPFKEYSHCVILQAIIPKSFYNLEEPYNTFTLNENGSQVTITIQPGNYGNDTFKTALLAQLNSASPNHYQYSMTFSNITGKFTYSVNTINPVSFIFSEGLYPETGFDYCSTNAFVPLGGLVSTLTSTNIIDFTLQESLYIRSNMTQGQDDILQEIYTNGYQDYSSIRFQQFELVGNAKELTYNRTNTYHFSITNTNGKIVNLHGRIVLMTLLLYKKDTINNVIRNYIVHKISNENTEKV